MFLSASARVTNEYACSLRTRRWLLRFGGVAHGKVSAIGVMEDQCADAGFGIHHESFRELHADFFGLQQFPDGGLIFQVGARGIAETIALASVAGREALCHGHLGCVGEAPVFTDTAMQPFGAGFGGFDGQSLQAMAQEIVAFVFCLFGALADTFSSSDDEKREVVALAILDRKSV